MSFPALPPEARLLLETSLSSYEKLEVLRAIKARGAPATRRDLEADTMLDAETINNVVAELIAGRFLLRDGAGAVAAGPLAQAPACDVLITMYANDRGAVLSVVSKIAMDRIRNMAARTFSDAFVLRKKKKGDGDDG